MPFDELDVADIEFEYPDDCLTYLLKAEPMVSEYVRIHPAYYKGFVASSSETVFQTLQAISESDLATGDTFCELGSGFGLNAALAGFIGFEAYGIELNPELFDASQELASEFDLPVEYFLGSFVPEGCDDLIDLAYTENDGRINLNANAEPAYSEMAMDLSDFDVLFIYPWPDDEQLVLDIVERFASDGALLLTYSEPPAVRVRRKYS